jgi:acyl carrier protein
MTTRTETAERVRAIIANALMRQADEIGEEMTLADLNADSLDRVEITMDCEEAFLLEISDAEAEGIQTVGNLVDLIERLRVAPAVA